MGWTKYDEISECLEFMMMHNVSNTRNTFHYEIDRESAKEGACSLCTKVHEKIEKGSCPSNTEFYSESNNIHEDHSKQWIPDVHWYENEMRGWEWDEHRQDDLPENKWSSLIKAHEFTTVEDSLEKDFVCMNSKSADTRIGKMNCAERRLVNIVQNGIGSKYAFPKLFNADIDTEYEWKRHKNGHAWKINEIFGKKDETRSSEHHDMTSEHDMSSGDNNSSEDEMDLMEYSNSCKTKNILD